MGIGDRDYMKASPDDERRIADYESGAHAREYGDISTRRRRALPRLAGWLILAALLMALVIAGLAGGR